MTPREIRKKEREINRAARYAIQKIDRDMKDAIELQKYIGKKQDMDSLSVMLQIHKIRFQGVTDEYKIREDAMKLIQELRREFEPPKTKRMPSPDLSSRNQLVLNTIKNTPEGLTSRELLDLTNLSPGWLQASLQFLRYQDYIKRLPSGKYITK